jgi:hypothetical protein
VDDADMDDAPIGPGTSQIRIGAKRSLREQSAISQLELLA